MWLPRCRPAGRSARSRYRPGTANDADRAHIDISLGEGAGGAGPRGWPRCSGGSPAPAPVFEVGAAGAVRIAAARCAQSRVSSPAARCARRWAAAAAPPAAGRSAAGAAALAAWRSRGCIRTPRCGSHFSPVYPRRCAPPGGRQLGCPDQVRAGPARCAGAGAARPGRSRCRSAWIQHVTEDVQQLGRGPDVLGSPRGPPAPARVRVAGQVGHDSHWRSSLAPSTCPRSSGSAPGPPASCWPPRGAGAGGGRRGGWRAAGAWGRAGHVGTHARCRGWPRQAVSARRRRRALQVERVRVRRGV